MPKDLALLAQRVATDLDNRLIKDPTLTDGQRALIQQTIEASAPALDAVCCRKVRRRPGQVAERDRRRAAVERPAN